MAVLFVAEHMRVKYRHAGGHLDAVQDVSLRVGKQELTAFVGGSGCGKSSLVRAVLGLLPENGHASGRVLLDGEEIFPPRAGMYAKIGFVPQNPMLALNPVRRVGAQLHDICCLALGMSSATARERCRNALEAMRLRSVTRVLASYPHELSGGMAQRVVLAAALLREPVLLIADEPTSALDAITRTELLDAIREVQRQGELGVLFVTHDMHLVGRYADTIYVMQQGSVVEKGETARMLTAPTHVHTKELLRAGRLL